jgi:hypothetical protein
MDIKEQKIKELSFHREVLMQSKINPGYQWAPQRLDEEFSDALMSNIIEFLKAKKINIDACLKKAGYEPSCDHPIDLCKWEKVAEISDPMFKSNEWQWKCYRCNSIVPKSFRDFPEPPPFT